MHMESGHITNNLWMTLFHWPKVSQSLLRDKGYYWIFAMIPYKAILNVAREQTPRIRECICAVLLNHCQLQLQYLKGFYIF